MGQSACPQRGSGADVRTAAELFDMLNRAQDGAVQAYLRQQMARTTREPTRITQPRVPSPSAGIVRIHA